jgi:rubredoxin-NAD+ reductase
MESVLILGNGQAGIALAREIRKLDPRRPITLLGRDAYGFNRSEFVQALGPTQKNPDL